MNEIDQRMAPDAMHAVYAKALYSLRESRKTLLRQYGVADEEALLGRIVRRELDGDAAYEHYLASRIIEQTRQQLRDELLARMKGEPEDSVPETCFHLAFKSLLESRYAERMSEPVRMAQDALLLAFDNGLMMELRYAGPDAFSVQWTWEERAFRLATSPSQGGGPGAPALHRDNGSIEPFMLLDPNADPRDWLSALLDRLMEDPVLETLAIRGSV